jgi:hypothetical protein
MRKWHGTRRWLLGSVGAFVATWASLGSGPGAGAEAKKRPNYGSKEAFKLECELLGGTFIDDGVSTVCWLAGVGSVVCDANGNNCTSHTSGRPSGGANSPDGTGTHVEEGNGGPGYPGLPGQTLPDTLPNLPGAGD